MKLRLVLVGFGALVLGVISAGAPAQAAPSLQLPWPTDTQHQINGGYTYGCGTHSNSAVNYYGIDFQFPTIGEIVTATATGEVTVAKGNDAHNGGAGNYLVVDHGGGYTSRYLHLRRNIDGGPFLSGIKKGVTVFQGQPIGYSGDTGGVPAHLHFDMQHDGSAYRPEPMSEVPRPGQNGFGWYGFSLENGVGCGSNPNDPSPYWTSQPPDHFTDFNGDDKDDAITFNEAGQGTVSFSTGSSFNVGMQGQVFGWGEIPAVGDFNGDGKDDVITFNTAGQGTVSFSDGNSFNVGMQGDVFSWGEIPGVGDFNGDGKDDAITYNVAGQGTVSFKTGTTFYVGFQGDVFTWGEIPGGFQTFAYEVIFDVWFDNTHDPPLWYP